MTTDINTTAPQYLNTITMDWQAVSHSLNNKGFAIIEKVLSAAECKHLSGLYDDQYLYRSTINMQRYRFGKGEYKYFNYPLPPTIQSLREIFYPPLALIANDWMQKLNRRKEDKRGKTD